MFGSGAGRDRINDLGLVIISSKSDWRDVSKVCCTFGTPMCLMIKIPSSRLGYLTFIMYDLIDLICSLCMFWLYMDT